MASAMTAKPIPRRRKPSAAMIAMGALVLAISAVGVADAATAPIYKCLGDNLGTIYTDQPCKGGERLDVQAGDADPTAVERLQSARDQLDRSAAARLAEERRAAAQRDLAAWRGASEKIASPRTAPSTPTSCPTIRGLYRCTRGTLRRPHPAPSRAAAAKFRAQSAVCRAAVVDARADSCARRKESLSSRTPVRLTSKAVSRPRSLARLIALSALIALTLGYTPANGEVFKCVDAAGKTSYQADPCPTIAEDPVKVQPPAPHRHAAAASGCSGAAQHRTATVIRCTGGKPYGAEPQGRDRCVPRTQRSNSYRGRLQGSA